MRNIIEQVNFGAFWLMVATLNWGYGVFELQEKPFLFHADIICVHSRDLNIYKYTRSYYPATMHTQETHFRFNVITQYSQAGTNVLLPLVIPASSFHMDIIFKLFCDQFSMFLARLASSFQSRAHVILPRVTTITTTMKKLQSTASLQLLEPHSSSIGTKAHLTP